MPCYKSGTIIKLTREACGMSQEILAEDICSVQTLSRIENGKTGVKRETYQRLMERLERFSGRNYAICVGDGLKGMDYIAEIDEAIRLHQYKNAEQYLKELERESLEGIIYRQYCIYNKAIIKSALKKITVEQKLKQMKEALSLTISDYMRYKNKVYPFTSQELTILMNIGSCFSQLRKPKEAIEIYDMLLRSLEYDYMSEYEGYRFKIAISFNRMKCLGELKQYRVAFETGKELLKCCKEYCCIDMIPTIAGETAWSILCGIENGELDETHKEECSYYLHLGYYIASAIEDENLVEIFKGVFKKI